MPTHPIDSRATILFDGICNLCNASVRAIVANDPAAHFRFAALQSGAARDILAAYGRTPESFASIVLVDGAGLSERSDAALRVACYLRFPWPLLGALFAVPRRARDRAYTLIARNRYRIFGTAATCAVPSPQLADRFL
ncbi:MAG: thiol-disulfide oxidoreductase DCC family protein [Vulcanimicrobiaceae bacterium]